MSTSDYNYFQGNVGIGLATTPSNKLHISADEQYLFRMENNDGVCELGVTAGNIDVNCASDASIKTDIKNAEPISSKFNDIRITEYTVNMTKESNITTKGVIAEEYGLIFPDRISVTNITEVVGMKVECKEVTTLIVEFGKNTPVTKQVCEIVNITKEREIEMVQLPTIWESIQYTQELESRVQVLESEVSLLKQELCKENEKYLFCKV